MSEIHSLSEDSEQETVSQASQEEAAASEEIGVVLPLFAKRLQRQIDNSSAQPMEPIAQDLPEQSAYGYYNNRWFFFDPKRMLGKGIIPASEESRLRAVALGLQAGWQGFEDVTPSLIRDKNTKFHNYTNSGIIIEGEETHYRALMPLKDAVEIVFVTLAIKNHPTYQAFQQLDHQFEAVPRGVRHKLREQAVVALHYKDVQSVFQLERKRRNQK